MPLCHTRIKTFGDFMDLCQFFFINHLHYQKELFTAGGLDEEKACFLLQAIIWSMDEQEDWGRAGIEYASRQVAEVFGVNHKKVVMPILFSAITSKHQGPPLFDSVDLLGKDRTRARLLRSIDFLGGISNKKMDILSKAWGKKDGKALFIP
jgi:glutamyl-tRNA synthetase